MSQPIAGALALLILVAAIVWALRDPGEGN
ncbi:hypothetical protein RKD49_005412 [Streptomyces glaucescens]|jgi:hypothetical protein